MFYLFIFLQISGCGYLLVFFWQSILLIIDVQEEYCSGVFCLLGFDVVVVEIGVLVQVVCVSGMFIVYVCYLGIQGGLFDL